MHTVSTSALCGECLESYLNNDSLLRMLPDNFTVRSAATRKVEIEPQTPYDNLKKKLGEHKFLQTTNQRGAVFYYFLTPAGQFGDMTLQGKHLSIQIQSSTEDAKKTADEYISRFMEYKLENKEPDGIWLDVCFWSQGVVRNTEFIRAPKWDDIRRNYPQADEIAKTINMKKPWERGRILIWYGPPGTGKTYAIRSLMMAWREDFNFAVIPDPENLTRNPAYYYSVASESQELPRGRYRKKDLREESEEEKESTRTLFILEDSADLIMPQSREHHYDKVNKFLNITDGLIGQGREDIFLLTFNEKEAEVDPAFMRAGRCISKLEFPDFETDSAVRWLREHDLEVDGDVPTTLADLYARLREARVARV